MTLASLSGKIGVALRTASRSFPGIAKKGVVNKTKIKQAIFIVYVTKVNQIMIFVKQMRCIYRCNTLEQCRMYLDQSQRCPINEQCDDGPRSCECYTPELHVLCNFVSSLHSIEHLNHEACKRRIYDPPSQKPAGNFLLQITAKRYLFTIANIGKGSL